VLQGLLLVYPAYLLSHSGDFVSGNHFNPFDRKLFTKDETVAAAVSSVAVVAWLGWLLSTFSLPLLMDAYFAPYFIFSAWLSLVTFLQHSDPKGVYYRDGEWTYLKVINRASRVPFLLCPFGSVRRPTLRVHASVMQHFIMHVEVRGWERGGAKYLRSRRHAPDARHHFDDWSPSLFRLCNRHTGTRCCCPQHPLRHTQHIRVVCPPQRPSCGDDAGGEGSGESAHTAADDADAFAACGFWRLGDAAAERAQRE